MTSGKYDTCRDSAGPSTPPNSRVGSTASLVSYSSRGGASAKDTEKALTQVFRYCRYVDIYIISMLARL